MTMNDIDERIREALDEEDRALFDRLDSELSLPEMLAAPYRGKQRWATLLITFWTVVFLALAVYAAVQYFQAADTHGLITWAVAFLVGILGVSMLKIWFWLEIQKNAILREIKRVELAVVQQHRGA